MISSPQMPSSAEQIFKALEDVEHSEFGERGGRLYVAHDSSGQIQD